jgi:hypothetical protein
MPSKTDKEIFENRILKLSASICARVKEFSKTYNKAAHATNKAQLSFLRDELILLNTSYIQYNNQKK